MMFMLKYSLTWGGYIFKAFTVLFVSDEIYLKLGNFSESKI